MPMDLQDKLLLQGWAGLPRFARKVEQSIQTIREALAVGVAPYVACSWGKDSTVMLHLVQQIKPDVAVISFWHPEREMIANYAEVEKAYCDRFAPNLTTIEMEGDHVPLKVQQARLWETYPMAFVGLRKEESDKRGMALSKYGLIHQFVSGDRAGTWRVCPLGFWGWKDVWAYIVSRDLPYLNAYDKQPLDRGRTTDHLSKTTNKAWQRRRLEGFRTASPAYYDYLQRHYPEMFY